MNAAIPLDRSLPPDRFKSVMRSFSSSVCVVTSAWQGQHFGMTATAVCSVSAEPPRVLIVVNRANRSHASIANGGSFTINLLSSAQRHLAVHFSSRPEYPFEGIRFEVGRNGCASIEGCEAVLECTVQNMVDEATHTIIVGAVEHAVSLARSVLVYHHGSYRELRVSGARGRER